MMGSIKVVLVVAVLVVAVSLWHGAPPVERRALADACRLSGYNCAGVEPPILRYGTMYGSGLHGAYFGGRLIYIADVLQDYPDLRYLAIVHETVHYLQAQAGGMSMQVTNVLNLCLLEQEAYRVQAGLASEMGLAHLATDETTDPRCDAIKKWPVTKP